MVKLTCHFLSGTAFSSSMAIKIISVLILAVKTEAMSKGSCYSDHLDSSGDPMHNITPAS